MTDEIGVIEQCEFIRTNKFYGTIVVIRLSERKLVIEKFASTLNKLDTSSFEYRVWSSFKLSDNVSVKYHDLTYEILSIELGKKKIKK